MAESKKPVTGVKITVINRFEESSERMQVGFFVDLIKDFG